MEWTGFTVRQALAAVLISGVVLAVAAASGVLTRLSGVVPPSLRNAAIAGIGIFIALVGLQNAKLITNGALGDLEDGGVWLFIFGFCLLLFLETIGCQNGVLITMVSISAIAWSAGLSDPPSKILDVADDFDAVWQISFKDWISPTYQGLFTLIYTDMLLQPSTLIAVSSLPGIRPGGVATHELPKYAWKVWFITGCCNVLAAILGCSPLLVVMESAAGIRSGGRTGLNSMVVALLFALSIFLAPVLASFPPEATACPLLLVGALMIGGVKDIDWRDMAEGGPAFITILMIPFTFNIGHGLLAGLLASLVCHIARQLRPWYARKLLVRRLEPPKSDNADFEPPQRVAHVAGQSPGIPCHGVPGASASMRGPPDMTDAATASEPAGFKFVTEV